MMKENMEVNIKNVENCINNIERNKIKINEEYIGEIFNMKFEAE